MVLAIYLRKKEDKKRLDKLCSNQIPNALNTKGGLLIQYNDKRKFQNTLRRFAVASMGNFTQYFMESRVPDGSSLGSLAETNCFIA